MVVLGCLVVWMVLLLLVVQVRGVSIGAMVVVVTPVVVAVRRLAEFPSAESGLLGWAFFAVRVVGGLVALVISWFQFPERWLVFS